MFDTSVNEALLTPFYVLSRVPPHTDSSFDLSALPALFCSICRFCFTQPGVSCLVSNSRQKQQSSNIDCGKISTKIQKRFHATKKNLKFLWFIHTFCLIFAQNAIRNAQIVRTTMNKLHKEWHSQLLRPKYAKSMWWSIPQPCLRVIRCINGRLTWPSSALFPSHLPYPSRKSHSGCQT